MARKWLQINRVELKRHVDAPKRIIAGLETRRCRPMASSSPPADAMDAGRGNEQRGTKAQPVPRRCHRCNPARGRL